MAETKTEETIRLTSVQSLVDHTYDGVLYPAGSIYNADERELENLEHHVRFARSASGARAVEGEAPRAPESQARVLGSPAPAREAPRRGTAVEPMKTTDRR
jgi:hypothetical protein